MRCRCLGSVQRHLFFSRFADGTRTRPTTCGGPSQIGRQSTGAPNNQRPRIRMIVSSKTCCFCLFFFSEVSENIKVLVFLVYLRKLCLWPEIICFWTRPILFSFSRSGPRFPSVWAGQQTFRWQPTSKGYRLSLVSLTAWDHVAVLAIFSLFSSQHTHRIPSLLLWREVAE